MQNKLLDRFNLAIFISTFGLVTIGLIAIFSATYSIPEASGNFYKQLLFACAGIIFVIIIMYLPPKYISLSSYFLYGLNLLLLLLVLLLGKKISGSTSWFSIGGFGIQPSEFAKFTTILALANYLTNKQIGTDITKPRDFFIAILIGLTPVFLILMQPDMGTAIVFIAFIVPLLYWAGMPNYILFIITVPAAAAVCAFLGTYFFISVLVLTLLGLLYFKRNILTSTIVFSMTILSGFSVNYIFNKLKPYQQNRITSLFNPESDALGSGWNVIQAKVAIGSGGLWGKGFLQGTQTQLKFIPEQWTDFIFCMVGEEFGFAGSIFVLLLFLTLIVQTINTAYLCKNKFLSTCCIGFATLFLFHTTVNLGMAMGIMPVIGIPLPFMSYGISFLVSNLCMIGIIMNAYRNRKEYT